MGSELLRIADGFSMAAEGLRGLGMFQSAYRRGYGEGDLFHGME